MVRMAADGGVPRVRVHAFLDGRDTPPRSAGASLATMAAVCAASPVCAIADIVGRYYAMDRDHRWERVRIAYELIVDGLADCGVAAAPRLRHRDDGPFVTDNGNLIYDAACGAILDPAGVEAALKSITGVVDHGLFLGLAERALISTDEGVVTAER